MPKNTPEDRPRRGRPPINPPELSERFQIRVTAEELREFKRLARSQGRTLSAWARIAIGSSIGRSVGT